MVYVDGMPVHPLAVGVMVIMAVIGAMPGLFAVNPGTLPVPLAPRPMAVLLLFQLNVAVAPTGLEIAVIGAETPLQYIWAAIEFIVGVGLTVTVNVIEGPEQGIAP